MLQPKTYPPRLRYGETGNLKPNRAFTIVEMLLVVFIITVAFMGIMSLVDRTITIYFDNKNQQTAVMLAQEGLELTRYVRDQNWLNNKNKGFSTDIASTTSSGGTTDNKTIFTIDERVVSANNRGAIIKLCSPEAGFTTCVAGAGYLAEQASGANALVYKYEDSVNGQIKYGQFTGIPATGYQPMIFHRLIQTIYNSNDDGTIKDDTMSVRVYIYWQDRGQNKSYVLDTLLTDYSWRYEAKQ